MNHLKEFEFNLNYRSFILLKTEMLTKKKNTIYIYQEKRTHN